MKILVFTNLYPNALDPDFGVFIRNRIVALNGKEGIEIRVVAPVPYFPPINISEKWFNYSQIPKIEIIDGIEVHHPRYFVSPKIGMSFYGLWMFLGALLTIKRLEKESSFDVIDAHFLYPDGFAAVLLGRFFKKPVTVSARGSDVNQYLTLPFVRHLVAWVLKNASHLVAVSASLKEAMVAHGAPADSISVIPNGIDQDVFFPKDKALVRQGLGLSGESKVLLTVCSLVELKGVHLLIEAVQRVKEVFLGSFRVLIVGKGPERNRLQEKITQWELDDIITLVGAVPNSELVDWYNAADVFFLGSSREGWPNVVGEALACGIPVVATNVNGIPEILDNEGLGIMVERSPEGFSQGILEAFSKTWDRDFILSCGRRRTWDNVAREVFAVLYGVTHR